jgi:Ni,Fe-hydrogenase III small subunit/NAD-dependent dihydropyrimidine dehydrogenase PreA subunit
MFRIIRERMRQGFRTFPFPLEKPPLPDRFRGLPIVHAEKCPEGCALCVDACPTEAIAVAGKSIGMDLGRCLFCTDCTRACAEGAIEFTTDYRLATRARADLVLNDAATLKLAEKLEEQALRLFGRSLKLRQVSAAGCNGCEADVNVLNTLVFDLGRFGIQFVASPRHADGLLITGPVSRNMLEALKITYEAVPAPKIVIAVGACAISGGPFRDHAEQCNGVEGILPVDLFVPGCPPHPWTILDGLLRLLGKIPDQGAVSSRPEA